MSNISTSNENTKEQVLSGFKNTFGEDGDIRVYFAPGRVNLIGEHTDYNGGAAMPAALQYGTWFAVRRRDDRALRFYSANFEEDGIIEGSLDDLEAMQDAKWARYPAGVIWAFEKEGLPIDTGMDVYVLGTIPNGAGLSSSASVEVGTGYILSDMYGLGVPNERLARLGQMAENDFVGVNCGIMDQYAIAMGRDGNAIFLRTSPLEHEYAPLDLGDAEIIIVSSNKQRGLGDSKYNERRAECETALKALQQKADIQSLGDLSVAQFEEIEDVVSDPVLRRRARHAVSENERTIKAKDALNHGDIEAFGQLMNASHDSLRDDYEVTGLELDTLVDSARSQPGVIGSRMTGAGFGGCTVNIVRSESVDDFIRNVGQEYSQKTGLSADFIPAQVGGGPRRM